MSTTDPQKKIRDSWRILLLELEFARNHHIAYQLHNSPKIRNPVLDKVLYSLFYIKAVTLLDEALDNYLTIHDIALPKKYKSNLHGRISFFGDSEKLTNEPELHMVRERRNKLAHEGSASASWPELEQCLTLVNSALQQLGFTGPKPIFQTKGERSSMQRSTVPGIVGHFDYSVAVLEGDMIAAEWTWREILPDDAT